MGYSVAVCARVPINRLESTNLCTTDANEQGDESGCGLATISHPGASRRDACSLGSSTKFDRERKGLRAASARRSGRRPLCAKQCERAMVGRPRFQALLWSKSGQSTVERAILNAASSAPRMPPPPGWQLRVPGRSGSCRGRIPPTIWSGSPSQPCRSASSCARASADCSAR